jgi:hypothetical protein
MDLERFLIPSDWKWVRMNAIPTARQYLIDVASKTKSIPVSIDRPIYTIVGRFWKTPLEFCISVNLYVRFGAIKHVSHLWSFRAWKSAKQGIDYVIFNGLVFVKPDRFMSDLAASRTSFAHDFCFARHLQSSYERLQKCITHRRISFKLGRNLIPLHQIENVGNSVWANEAGKLQLHGYIPVVLHENVFMVLLQNMDDERSYRWVGGFVSQTSCLTTAKSDGYEEVTAQYIVTNRLSIDNELQNLSHDVANYVRGRSVRRRADVLHSTFVERWKSVVLDESEIEL